MAKQIDIRDTIHFPRDLVFETYRDKLPELVAYLPNIESITVDVYPRVERSLFERLFSEMVADEETLEAVTLPPVVRAWLAAASFPSGAALTLMPWSIEVR